MPLRVETERLILTPEEPSDAEWFSALLNTRGTGTFTVADALERIAIMTETIEATGIGALVLREREDGEPLGYVAIVVGRGSLAEPELAYELLPRAHGHGYATEAARALLDVAFETGRRRIWSTIGAWNAPSLRVAEKLGFRCDHRTTEVVGEVVWMVSTADHRCQVHGGADRTSEPPRRTGPEGSAPRGDDPSTCVHAQTTISRHSRGDIVRTAPAHRTLDALEDRPRRSDSHGTYPSEVCQVCQVTAARGSGR